MSEVSKEEYYNLIFSGWDKFVRNIIVSYSGRIEYNDLYMTDWVVHTNIIINKIETLEKLEEYFSSMSGNTLSLLDKYRSKLRNIDKEYFIERLEELKLLVLDDRKRKTPLLFKQSELIFNRPYDDNYPETHSMNLRIRVKEEEKNDFYLHFLINHAEAIKSAIGNLQTQIKINLYKLESIEDEGRIIDDQLKLELIEYVSNDNIEKVLDKLGEFCKKSEDSLLSDWVNLKSRWKRLNKQRNSGVVGFEEINQESNRINKAIIDFINEL